MTDDIAQENKLIVRRVFYEMANNNKYSLINYFFNSRVQLRINGGYTVGRNKLLTLLKILVLKVPSQHFEIMSVFGEGDMVCAHWTFIAKFDEGNQIISTIGITVFRFRSGKIIQVDQQWDYIRLQPAIRFAKTASRVPQDSS